MFEALGAFYVFMGGTPWMAAAFFLNIGSVLWLAMNRKVLGWVFGLLGSITLAVVVFQGAFYADFLLMIYYTITCAYGLYLWKFKPEQENKPERPILRTPKYAWLWMGLVVALLTLVFGYWFTALGSDIAYIDSFTTAISVVAQFALAKKWFGNWGLWVLADVIDIPLYWSKGLAGVSILTMVYLGLCLYALWNWGKDWVKQGDAPNYLNYLFPKRVPEVQDVEAIQA